MSKNSSNSDLESFIDNLDTTRKEETVKEVGDELSFAGNVIEVPHEERIEAEQESEELELGSFATLRKSIAIFSELFFSFTRDNIIISIALIATLFGLISKLELGIHDIKSALEDPLHNGYLLIGITAIFWIFFSWLRCAFLKIVSDYFNNESSFPLFFGLKKLFSFLILETMQIVMILLGTLLIFLAPFFSARYFLAMPLLIEEDDDAIGAIISSSNHVDFWMLLVMHHMMLISIFVVFVLTCLYFILRDFVSSHLVLYSSLFFIFSFFLLPIHCCFRFLTCEKIKQLVKNESLPIIKTSNKLTFVISRFIALALILTLIALIITGAIDGSTTLSIDNLAAKSGLSSFFENMLGDKGQDSATPNY